VRIYGDAMVMAEQTDCCIVGCGPAGAMLGLMLARQGVDVVVVEKHRDFLRDFRGDDISPATIEILDDLGIADDFLALRPKRVQSVEASTPGGPIKLADLSRVRTRFPFFAVIPQWDFLDFVTKQAAKEAGYRLLLGAEATGLLGGEDTVRGVRCMTGEGTLEIRARLTVAADGRYSRLRSLAGLPLVNTSAPIDVLWFRLPHTSGATEDAMSVHLGGGQVMARIDRDTYWQVACVVAKGSAEAIMNGDIARFAETVARCMPDLEDEAAELYDWDQVSLLSVQTNRLRRWYRPGLICIGDAAHAMSPIGGAGINFAIGDAVALSNRAAAPVAHGDVPIRALAAVQRERAWQVRLMQSMQAPLTRAYVVLAEGSPGQLTLVQKVAPRLANLPGFSGSRSRITALGIRRSTVARAARR
jgi:2-polyprenyl-6-methoxyphenol hydroxylase-like FAD-dependent oxidoreductase